MKLQPGDKIWITKADDVCAPGYINYGVRETFDAEWDGEKFLGCVISAVPLYNAEWTIEVMNHYQVGMQRQPGGRTDIDCMFEQLTAAGMLP